MRFTSHGSKTATLASLWVLGCPVKTLHGVSMLGGSQFRAESGRMLEDALRAGVMDKLISADKPFIHRYLAPGTKAVRDVHR